MAVALSKVLERFPTRIDAQTDAAVLDIAGPLPVDRPDHLRHKGYSIYALLTETIARHHGDADVRVRDRIVVDLAWRVIPKDQRTGARGAADLVSAIVVAVTAKSWTKDASWNAVTRDDVEVHYVSTEWESVGAGEWLRLLVNFDVRRNQDIG